MEDRHLLDPLLTTNSTRSTTIVTSENDNDVDNTKVISSNWAIIFRLVLVIFIGLVSVWANCEASKGFEISITNDAADFPAGQRFTLFFVSNDKARRMVLKTSKFVEGLLYPNNSNPKKQVNHVILRLAGQNLTHTVVVDSGKEYEYVLHISPSVMEETNVNHDMLSAVLRGMTRIWLYENAPTSLIDGVVQYISSLAGLGGVSDSSSGESPESDEIWWKDKSPLALAHFLNCSEVHKKGFIRLLNQAMKVGWHERTVNDLLGMSAKVGPKVFITVHPHQFVIDDDKNGEA
ncbi:hypothetical protein F0562_010423 [Nyssa sinensis]|uniref:Uncharacterized protein n=1 Tax=Nyssa sinensis TaxID=561372 RepID=A0A5J5A265_9ASTE|nr:hypothetical protein F0562_010423 [Nyssa sinensis]